MVVSFGIFDEFCIKVLMFGVKVVLLIVMMCFGFLINVCLGKVVLYKRSFVLDSLVIYVRLFGVL